jgi:transporter family protein
MTNNWLVWALLSAVFAASTAIFAKVGVANVNSDYATLIRTIVILVIVTGIVWGTGQFQARGSISARTYLFLALSGCATGGIVAVLFPRSEAGRSCPGCTDR